MENRKQTQILAQRIPGPMMPRPSSEVAGLTPKEIWGIFRRHLFLIFFLSVLGFIAGGASWYLLSAYLPKYTSVGYIRVLSPAEKDPTSIGGAMVNEKTQYGFRVSMAQLLKRDSALNELINRDKVQETKWFKSFGDIKDKRIRKSIKELKKRLGVYADRESEFVRVTMTCRDKEEAALIVNEMTDLFIISQGSTKREEVTAKLAKLTVQRTRISRDLKDAENALDQVRSRWGFTNLEKQNFQHTITAKLARLEEDQSELSMEISQTESILKTLKRQAQGPVQEQVSSMVERDPTVVMLTQQIVVQETRLAGSLTKFGENHRVVRQLQETINETKVKKQVRKAEISEQTRQANLKNAMDQYTVLGDRMKELEKLKDETAARKRDLDMARVQYAKRLETKQERRERLDEVTEQIEKMKMMHDDPETPKVQRVGRASVPLEKSFPKWQVFFPGGTMLGLMLGVGLAFLIELLNDLVRTPRDVIKHLHLPLLAVVPDAIEDRNLKGIDLSHVLSKAPYSIVSESYRQFRTNLKLSASAESLKTILVSSAMPGDGTTSVAVNLALAFIAENKKILLVDANFWKPKLHDMFLSPQDGDLQNEEEDAETQFSSDAEFGLSTMLSGLCGYQEIIRPSSLEGLDIINSGPLPSNPAELLGGEQMEHLIVRQRQNYDYVIIDSPPALLVSSARELAKLVDSTVLVFNATATHRGVALRTIRELREVDAKILGCILMAVKAMKGGYFDKQFKSYEKYQEMQLASSI